MSPTKEETEERKHFRKVVKAFRNYSRDSKDRLHRTMDYLKKIPLKHQQMINQLGFEDSLKSIDNCIELNANVLNEIVDDVDKMFENAKHDSKKEDEDTIRFRTANMDMDKVQSTLKQFVRDWSEDGRQERRQCYDPILDELESIYGNLTSIQRSRTKVLVPGAGLGRLAYEIASRGFVCQGNEFSLYMLMGSNYVLNKCKHRNCCQIYPWIHHYTNNLSAEDQIRSAMFPDICPADMPADANFSMVAGDFLEVYGEDKYLSSQDCVVTCFFIDCAHNILEFIELIHRILKPGGRWINLGPLMYHFADVPRESSIEPSYDIVRNLVEQTGFQFVMEKKDHEATYCQNERSMLQYKYKCIFFTCVKK